MGVPQDIDELSQDQLRLALAASLGEVAELKRLVRLMADEIARLKDLNQRPKIKPNKPSGMEQGTSGNSKRGGKGSGGRLGRGPKRTPCVAVEDQVISPEIPPGARFKGFQDYIVQDLVIRPRVIRYRRARWVTADGETVIAPLPAGVQGHFGPELRRYVLMQYHQGQVTVPRLVVLLKGMGIDISKRQVLRLLIEGKEAFLAEAQDVLRSGLAAAPWLNVDDTGARHKGKNNYCTVIGNEHFAWFGTTQSKSRENFLDLLRAGHSDYVISKDALAYMRERHLSAAVCQLLTDHPDQHFADLETWTAHLERLGIAALDVLPDPVLIATEGALWGSVKAHGFLNDTVILSDDAGQFNVGRHALCWIHSERLVYKLDAFSEANRAAQAHIRGLIWELYADLKAYRQAPAADLKASLTKRFDAIFTTNSSFTLLNRLLKRIYRNKTELLRVLDYPHTPLHTNGAENDIRCQVTKRKVSGGTRSDTGRDCRNAFLGIAKTCSKLSINFWDYLGARLNINDPPDIPNLAHLVSRQYSVA
jgi:Transposase IS66 family